MELQRFVKKHDVNPLKTLVGVLVQARIHTLVNIMYMGIF